MERDLTQKSKQPGNSQDVLLETLKTQDHSAHTVSKVLKETNAYTNRPEAREVDQVSSNSDDSGGKENVPVNKRRKRRDQESSESEVSRISSDAEYIDSVQSQDYGRSKKKINKKLKKQENRHTSVGKKWRISCLHNSDSAVCKVASLSETDIDHFFTKLYENKRKVDQDKYLLSLVSVSKPKRLRRKNEADLKKAPKYPRKERVTMSYHIVNRSTAEKVPVCSESFASITNISRHRINHIAKNFFMTQEAPREKRGGSRTTANDDEVTKSIIDHIESFKCKKSHYIRKDTGRSYLHPELSIKKMYKLWKLERHGMPKASYSKYYSVFVTKFNLAFCHPRQDVCSYCTEMKVKMKKRELSEENKQNLQRDLSVHKANAKKFFQLLQERKPGTVSVSFDMMQNQPLPKHNVTDVFYSRQVWVYNLTFVICSEGNEGKDNNFLYTWTETEAARGPNEVCTCLLNFLHTLEDRYKEANPVPHTLRLFSDSCSAQNKNQFVMGVLLHFVNKSTVFKKIEHYFPVRGHSYMPADRTFGRIEQALRKKSKIFLPSEYHKIFSKFATVKVYGKDIEFLDYKSYIKSLFKTLPFKSTEQKVYTYISGKQTVGVAQGYGLTPVRVSVLRKGKTILNMNPAPQPKESHVKEPKRKNVEFLLRFVDMSKEAREFYSDIIATAGNGDVGEEAEEYTEDTSF